MLEDNVSEVMEQEEDFNNDLMNQEVARVPLTPEEQAMVIYKELSSKNPQAAHNIMQYSFKERKFIRLDETMHIVNHYSVDGDKLLTHHPLSEKDAAKGIAPTETDEFREQEDFHQKRIKDNEKLLQKINAMIKDQAASKLTRRCNRRP